MRKVCFGVIAEDESDVDVVKEIVAKYRSKDVTFQRFIGHGHGKIQSKCLAWSDILVARGCDHVIVLHDSDRTKPSKVAADLASAMTDSKCASKVIVVPVQEIEAWLLADVSALNQIFNLKKHDKIAFVSNPESINSPKEKIKSLVYIKSRHKKRYVNSVHNRAIANLCSMNSLQRCQSYAPLHKFLTTTFSEKKKNR